MTKHVAPSTSETAFNCPHCGAYTTQNWFRLCAEPNRANDRLPLIGDEKLKERLSTSSDISDEMRSKILTLCSGFEGGVLFFEDLPRSTECWRVVRGLNISVCYNCGQQSVWVYRTLVHPPSKLGPLPNADLPPDIVSDFEEARAIVNLSPRGAAALLRLCVQKLCRYLGESGKNIDDDIGRLVEKGLAPLIKKSLDIVRVVGNEAVHPGSMDLRDDPETALRLFDIINAIADQMISHPKTVEKLYGELPPTKLAGIERRDAKGKPPQVD